MIEMNESLLNAELAKALPVAVDFWAGWCMPCKVFAPVIEEIARELDGKVTFGKVNVDDNSALAVRYRVESIPTLMIFKNGTEAERIVGVQSKAAVLAAINKYL